MFLFYHSIIIILSFIKKICCFAFCSCKDIKQIKFEEDSQLEIIDDNAFKSTSIESTLIPSSVTQIEDSSFQNCHNLQKVQFNENSKLKAIWR